MRLKDVLSVVCLLATAAPAICGTHLQTCYSSALDAIRKLPPGSAERTGKIRELLHVGQNLTCFADYVVEQQTAKQQQAAFFQAIKALEDIRTDKQAGSSTGTGGTTNLVSKGLAAQALSVASEYGALTESVNSQTVTVNGSLDGAAAALIRQNFFAYCPSQSLAIERCIGQRPIRFLRRFSYGVSFNTNQNSQNVNATPAGAQQGSAQPVNFTANPRQISSVTGKAILWDARDDTSDAFQQQWKEQLAKNTEIPKAAHDVLVTMQTFFGTHDFELSDAYVGWFNSALAQMQAATDNELDQTWQAQLSKLYPLINDPGLSQNATKLLAAVSKLQFDMDQFADSIAEKPVLTFEYDENRPLGQPSNSSFRLIYDKGFTKKWSVTANAAAAIYDSPVSTMIPGASRFRDAQAALQLQYNLGSFQSIGAAALSGAYYFQDQHSPSILNVTPGMPLPGITFTGLPSTATQVFAQKGNLHIAQLRLELGAGKTSVRVPISVSYSNRTELIAKPAWRAQIGLSYDFDSLFAKAPSGNTGSQ